MGKKSSKVSQDRTQSMPVREEDFVSARSEPSPRFSPGDLLVHKKAKDLNIVTKYEILSIGASIGIPEPYIYHIKAYTPGHGYHKAEKRGSWVDWWLRKLTKTEIILYGPK